MGRQPVFFEHPTSHGRPSKRFSAFFLSPFVFLLVPQYPSFFSGKRNEFSVFDRSGSLFLFSAIFPPAEFSPFSVSS